MNFSDYIVYVDESGDHGLKIAPLYPIFVLAFCVFECQIAFKTDPGLASKIDPPNGLVMSLFLTLLKTVRVIMSFDNRTMMSNSIE